MVATDVAARGIGQYIKIKKKSFLNSFLHFSFYQM